MKAFAAILALSLPASASAHHSFAMFNSDKVETMAATVKSFDMVNPHSWLTIAVADEAGKIITWSLEMGDPAQLTHEGWTKTVVQPGDKVTVRIHPRLDGSHGGQLMSIRLPNGQALAADQPSSLAP